MNWSNTLKTASGLAMAAVAALSLEAYAGEKGQQIPSAGGSSISSSAQQQDNAVAEVQKTLKSKGYEVGSVDGKWGPQSMAALKQYQRENDLQVTGSLNRETAESLGISTGEFARFEQQAGQTPASEPQRGQAPASEQQQPGAQDRGGAPATGEVQ